jgi:hypothetical protein
MRRSKLTVVVLALVALIMFARIPDRAVPMDRLLAVAYCSEKGDLPPKAFASDICSRWPDGAWGSCCMEHDIKYWCGGGSADRLAADQGLRTCVDAVKPGMGTLMFWGTRISGVSWLPTPYRWGYGWTWPHFGN